MAPKVKVMPMSTNSVQNDATVQSRQDVFRVSTSRAFKEKFCIHAEHG